MDQDLFLTTLGIPIDSLEARNEYKAIIMKTKQMKKTTNTYKVIF